MVLSYARIFVPEKSSGRERLVRRLPRAIQWHMCRELYLGSIEAADPDTGGGVVAGSSAALVSTGQRVGDSKVGSTAWSR
eukprot:3940399-Rhodomonas_salina.1